MIQLNLKTIFIILFYSCLISAQSNTNQNLEKELLKVKNQAFCDCYYQATTNEPVEYKDGSTYIQLINLKGEYIFQNEDYSKMITDWNKKEYKSYDSNNNLYLMRCLDFYNSEELKKFINSIRENELRLMKN